MKTQIIKIIPCLVAGFILSACVGAVNVPSDVAEKKTESEPIVLDPATVLINRCIMEGNANDASCAPIVEDNPCITDPFGAACDITFADYYETAQANRISFCRKDATHNLCASAIENVCDDNPFDADLCFSTNAYYQTHESMCEADLTAPRCEKTVNRVCARNAFDTDLCFGNSDYNNSRERTCARESNSERCTATITRVCGADSLDTLCNGLTAYFPAQYAACENEPNSERCTATTTRVCTRNPLNALCNGNEIYYPAQKTACESMPLSARCAPIIANLVTWVCTKDSLDELCDGNETYFTAQKTVCAGDNPDSRCDRIIVGLCPETPFDMFCQSKNLTLRDLPARPNNNFRDSPSNINSSYASCPETGLFRCSIYYPSIINIKPLNNTNTGIAIYAGSASISFYLNYGHTANQYNSRQRSDNISLMVNFDNNTLTHFTSEFFKYISFRVNGNFTDRGIITGSVEIGSEGVVGGEAPLIGLIGQNTAVGFFANETNDGNFAGRFTATRE